MGGNGSWSFDAGSSDARKGLRHGGVGCPGGGGRLAAVGGGCGHDGYYGEVVAAVGGQMGGMVEGWLGRRGVVGGLAGRRGVVGGLSGRRGAAGGRSGRRGVVGRLSGRHNMVRGRSRRHGVVKGRSGRRGVVAGRAARSGGRPGGGGAVLW